MRGRAARHAGVVHASADDRLRGPAALGRRVIAGPVSERADDAASREQPRHHSLLSGRYERAGGRRAVLVLPQWNADEGGHVGLCRLLARFGMSALRLSLPYHDTRMPPELTRADYIVSANVVRTLEVCRQAVLDARRAIAWLAGQGYDRIGILGTSLGSCLSMLTACHEPLIRAQALNHISPVFRRRRLEGALHAPCEEGAGRRGVARRLAGAVAADQPAGLPRHAAHARHEVAAGVRPLRPDVPGRSLAQSSSPSSAHAASRTRCRCCRAATTAQALRRSSSWTARC